MAFRTSLLQIFWRLPVSIFGLVIGVLTFPLPGIIVVGPAVAAIGFLLFLAIKSVRIFDKKLMVRYGPLRTTCVELREVEHWEVRKGPDHGKSVWSRNPFAVPRYHQIVLTSSRWPAPINLFDRDVLSPGYTNFVAEMREQLGPEKPERPELIGEIGVEQEMITTRSMESLDQRSWNASGILLILYSVVVAFMAVLSPGLPGVRIVGVLGLVCGMVVGLIWARTRRRALPMGFVGGASLAFSGIVLQLLGEAILRWSASYVKDYGGVAWVILTGLYFGVLLKIVSALRRRRWFTKNS